MLWVKEIRKVGLMDWLWFVVWLRRNEFHRRLDMVEYFPNGIRLAQQRRRAHRIDMALSE